MRGDLTIEALLEHQDFMRALAKSLLFGDEHRADDVVQQAWLAALKNPPRDLAKVRSWLGKVVRNFALRRRRDDARRARREHGAPAREPVPSTAEILDRENTRRRVVLAVLDLDEPYRSAVVLRYLEDLKPGEIARRLGVPVETVRTRLKRALERLRGKLDAAHDGDRRAWSLALVPFAATTGSAAAAGAIAGVLAMGSKTKVGVAAALIVLCALLAWNTTRPGAGDAGTVERRSDRGAVATPALADVPDTGPATATDAVPDAPEPPPPGTGSIRGRVVANGAPVAGAYVGLSKDGERADEVFGTDADGAFRFDVTGAFTLRAAHPAHGPVVAAVEVAADEVREVVLELPTALAVEIRVVDRVSGAPVRGAEVFLLRSGNDGHNKAFHESVQTTLMDGGTIVDIAERLSAYDSVIEAMQVMNGETELYVPPLRTDGQGRVLLGGLLPGRLEAVVNHPDYTSALVRERTVDPARPIRVALGRGASLTVVAPRYGGRPAAGYACELSRASLIPMPIRRETFDEDGRVTFALLRPGSYIVTVSPHGTWNANMKIERGTDEDGAPTETRSMSLTRAQTGDTLERTVNVDASRQNVLDLSDVKGATVTGRVVGGDGPWTVRLVHEERTQATSGTSQPDATFRFAHVAPGAYRVVAAAVAGGGEVAADCTVRASDTEVEVELRAATGIVSGLVTDADGRPLPEASLFLLARTTPMGSFADPTSFDDLVNAVLAKATTGPDGMFRMESVPAGGFDLFCGKNRHLARVAFTLGEGESQRVDVRLAPSDLHRLTVRLTDGAGGPVAGHLVVRDARAGLLAAYVCDPDCLDPSRPAAAEHAYQLVEGRYLLDVYAEGRAPVRSLPVHVLAGRDLELPLPAGVPVRLRLVRGGEALAERLVRVRFDNGALFPAASHPLDVIMSQGRWTTDANGVLVLPRVAPGRYELVVEGHKPVEFRVRGQPVERTLRVGE